MWAEHSCVPDTGLTTLQWKRPWFHWNSQWGWGDGLHINKQENCSKSCTPWRRQNESLRIEWLGVKVAGSGITEKQHLSWELDAKKQVSGMFVDRNQRQIRRPQTDSRLHLAKHILVAYCILGAVVNETYTCIGFMPSRKEKYVRKFANNHRLIQFLNWMTDSLSSLQFSSFIRDFIRSHTNPSPLTPALHLPTSLSPLVTTSLLFIFV